ncbi:MAG: DUF1405 domain-containing protein [Anaerolineae bacterium]|nr:DUF1405 domain-containing protein [Anaerolineae bacterium]
MRCSTTWRGRADGDMSGATVPAVLSPFVTLYKWASAQAMRPLPALLIIGANLVGTIWGVIGWYGGQLAVTPVWLWPFVPKSPGSAFIFIPAFVLILLGRSWPLLNLFAAFALFKYGLWTVIFWFLYWVKVGGQVDVMGVAMTATHWGMVLQGLFLLAYIRPRPWQALALGVWFLFLDWLDYGVGIYPGLPDPALVPVMAWESVVSTILLAVLMFALAWRNPFAVGRGKA